MRRKGLLLVISLLALATLMAAMSFSSATVQAKANLTITNSAKGLVALLPGDGTTASKDDLTMDFTDGTVDKGIQPGSVYTWDNLFTIQNNTHKSIKVRLSDLDGLTNFVSAAFYADNKPLTDFVEVAPGQKLTVKATIDATNTNAQFDKKTFQIKVDAEQD